LLVGANYARGLALAAGLPFVGVNHLEGHVYANWLYETEDIPPEPELPAVVLVVSGAHSDLVLMEAHRRFRALGRTIDDAAGEAFDKVARLLHLGFPGGPVIERIAKEGNPNAFPLPRALPADRFDFSFSGLKTAGLRLVLGLAKTDGSGNDVPELVLRILGAASGTDSVRESLKDVKAGRALLRFTDIGRAIEFKAGAGELHAEPADLKGPGPKVDATSATWLGL